MINIDWHFGRVFYQADSTYYETFISSYKFVSSMWGHAILYTASLIWLCPSSIEIAFSQKFFVGCVLNIFYLLVFDCYVWVPIPKPQHCTIGAQEQEDIYVGFDSLYIIHYINLSTPIVLHASFNNCRFEEYIFLSLKWGVSISKTLMSLTFKAFETFTLNSNPKTSLAQIEVAKTLHLQKVAN